MPEEKLRRTKAIANNEGLYKAVFAAHDVDLKQTADIYYSASIVPPLNSNICTKSPAWKPDAIFDAIEKNATEQSWKNWSVKDSFSCLDLRDRGFKKLFDAQWLYLEASQFKPALHNDTTFFKKVVTSTELDTWINVWGEGEQIYNARMLSKPDMLFLIGYKNEEECCAALLNRTDDVIGVSNFFPKDNVAEKWTDLVTFIHEQYGPTDVVGYERKETLEKLASIGARSVGNLTIWITAQSH